MRADNSLLLVWGSVDPVFARVVEIHLVLDTGRKWSDCSVSIEIELVLVWVAEIYLISMWGVDSFKKIKPVTGFEYQSALTE